ncbi:MAG: NAD(P)/FAD-dependent oxidoreductase [Chitinophagales bacterium]
MREKYYKFYNPKMELSGYDFIIVGSGIAGLTAAVILAKEGYKVLVLEQHYRPGGFTHTFKRKDGYFWDVGVHYVGNADKGEAIRPIFNYLTNSELEWESMGDIYDRVIIDKDVYDFYKGKENHKAQMIKYFPDEKEAIEQYFKLIDKYSKLTGAFLFEKTFKPILSYTLGWAFKKYFAQYAKKTTQSVLDELTNNQRLKAVLSAQFGDYGMLPTESSFAVHAMVINHFINGGNYPVGGADQISIKMNKVLDSLGSLVLVNAKVSEIVIENNKVKGVKIEDRFISCPNVISNAGVKNTFNSLVKTNKSAIKKAIDKLNPSVAHFCLYVGLNKSDKELNLPKHNVWYHKTDDFTKNIEESSLEEIAQNFAYISFPSAKDKAWRENNKNKATIQAVSPAKYEWFKKYEDLKVMKRGAEYEALKKQFEEAMLQKLYELFPQIKGHVEITEVSTPLSTKHYTNYQQGEIYGLEHSPRRLLTNQLRFETKIKGLTLTGQDITMVGVGGAMAAGMMCVIPILKFKSFRIFYNIFNP